MNIEILQYLNTGGVPISADDRLTLDFKAAKDFKVYKQQRSVSDFTLCPILFGQILRSKAEYLEFKNKFRKILGSKRSEFTVFEEKLREIISNDKKQHKIQHGNTTNLFVKLASLFKSMTEKNLTKDTKRELQNKSIVFLEDFYSIQQTFQDYLITNDGLSFIKFIKQPIDNIENVDQKNFPIASAQMYKKMLTTMNEIFADLQFNEDSIILGKYLSEKDIAPERFQVFDRNMFKISQYQEGSQEENSIIFAGIPIIQQKLIKKFVLWLLDQFITRGQNFNEQVNDFLLQEQQFLLLKFIKLIVERMIFLYELTLEKTDSETLLNYAVKVENLNSVLQNKLKNKIQIDLYEIIVSIYTGKPTKDDDVEDENVLVYEDVQFNDVFWNFIKRNRQLIMNLLSEPVGFLKISKICKTIDQFDLFYNKIGLVLNYMYEKIIKFKGGLFKDYFFQGGFITKNLYQWFSNYNLKNLQSEVQQGEEPDEDSRLQIQNYFLEFSKKKLKLYLAHAQDLQSTNRTNELEFFYWSGASAILNFQIQNIKGDYERDQQKLNDMWFLLNETIQNDNQKQRIQQYYTELIRKQFDQNFYSNQDFMIGQGISIQSIIVVQYFVTFILNFYIFDFQGGKLEQKKNDFVFIKKFKNISKIRKKDTYGDVVQIRIQKQFRDSNNRWSAQITKNYNQMNNFIYICSLFWNKYMGNDLKQQQLENPFYIQLQNELIHFYSKEYPEIQNVDQSKFKSRIINHTWFSVLNTERDKKVGQYDFINVNQDITRYHPNLQNVSKQIQNILENPEGNQEVLQRLIKSEQMNFRVFSIDVGPLQFSRTTFAQKLQINIPQIFLNESISGITGESSEILFTQQNDKLVQIIKQFYEKNIQDQIEKHIKKSEVVIKELVQFYQITFKTPVFQSYDEKLVTNGYRFFKMNWTDRFKIDEDGPIEEIKIDSDKIVQQIIDFLWTLSGEESFYVAPVYDENGQVAVPGHYEQQSEVLDDPENKKILKEYFKQIKNAQEILISNVQHVFIESISVSNIHIQKKDFEYLYLDNLRYQQVKQKPVKNLKRQTKKRIKQQQEQEQEQSQEQIQNEEEQEEEKKQQDSPMLSTSEEEIPANKPSEEQLIRDRLKKEQRRKKRKNLNFIKLIQNVSELVLADQQYQSQAQLTKQFKKPETNCAEFLLEFIEQKICKNQQKEIPNNDLMGVKYGFTDWETECKKILLKFKKNINSMEEIIEKLLKIIEVRKYFNRTFALVEVQMQSYRNDAKPNYCLLDILKVDNEGIRYSHILQSQNQQDLYQVHAIMQKFLLLEISHSDELFKEIDHYIIFEEDHCYIGQKEIVNNFISFINQQIQPSRFKRLKQIEKTISGVVLESEKKLLPKQTIEKIQGNYCIQQLLQKQQQQGEQEQQKEIEKKIRNVSWQILDIQENSKQKQQFCNPLLKNYNLGGCLNHNLYVCSLMRFQTRNKEKNFENIQKITVQQLEQIKVLQKESIQNNNFIKYKTRDPKRNLAIQNLSQVLMEPNIIEKQILPISFPKCLSIQQRFQLQLKSSQLVFDIETTSKDILIPLLIACKLTFVSKKIHLFNRVRNTKKLQEDQEEEDQDQDQQFQDQEAAKILEIYPPQDFKEQYYTFGFVDNEQEQEQEQMIGLIQNFQKKTTIKQNSCLLRFVLWLRDLQCQIWKQIISQFDMTNDQEQKLFFRNFDLIKQNVQIICYGWNSSGFDLPLILPYIIFTNDGDNIQILGGVDRIKIMNWGIFVFKDMFLTLPMKLSTACRSLMNKSEYDQYAKNSNFDIVKEGSTIEDFRKNYDKIKAYCIQDLIATEKVLQLFMGAYRKIFEEIKIKVRQYVLDFFNLPNFNIKQESEIQLQNIEDISEHFVPNTISSIAQTLFNSLYGYFKIAEDLFLQNQIPALRNSCGLQVMYYGTLDKNIHKIERNSYKGGLTMVLSYQTLYKGYYLDVNSLYPFALSGQKIYDDQFLNRNIQEGKFIGKPTRFIREEFFYNKNIINFEDQLFIHKPENLQQLCKHILFSKKPDWKDKNLTFPINFRKYCDSKNENFKDQFQHNIQELQIEEFMSQNQNLLLNSISFRKKNIIPHHLYQICYYRFKPDTDEKGNKVRTIFIPISIRSKDNQNFQFREFNVLEYYVHKNSKILIDQNYVLKLSEDDVEQYCQYIWGMELLVLLHFECFEQLIIRKRYIYASHPKNLDILGFSIGYIYDQRAIKKTQGDEAGQTALKLIMNSAYGKFAQELFTQKHILNQKSFVGFIKDLSLKNGGDVLKAYEQIKQIKVHQTVLDYCKKNKDYFQFVRMDQELEQLDIINQEEEEFIKQKNCKNGYRVVKEPEDLFKVYNLQNPIIEVETKKPEFHHSQQGALTFEASSTTAYARAVMTYYIYNAGPQNVFYMDTDSIIVNQQGYEKLLKQLEVIDSSKLGFLKNELDKKTTNPQHYFESFTAFAPKIYECKYSSPDKKELQTKNAFKGVRNPSNQLYDQLRNQGFANVYDQNRLKKVSMGSIINQNVNMEIRPQNKTLVDENNGKIIYFENLSQVYSNYKDVLGIIKRDGDKFMIQKS